MRLRLFFEKIDVGSERDSTRLQCWLVPYKTYKQAMQNPYYHLPLIYMLHAQRFKAHTNLEKMSYNLHSIPYRNAIKP